MEEINSIKWHENNLKNGTEFEVGCYQGLLAVIDRKLKYLNSLSKENLLKKYQIDCAKKENKTKFTDKYKRKIFNAMYPKDKYEINMNQKNRS